MKRTVGLGLAIALSAVTAGGQSRRASVVVVQLLAVNDFHGNIEPPFGANGRVGKTEAGGAEYLATHLKNDVAENPNSLVVAAGDLIGASPLASSLFHDEPAILALNAMHLAVSSVGNHEFDHGPRELLRMQKLATFQYLAANVVRTTGSTTTTLVPATTVRRIGGVNVGFIGETLRGTPQIVAPASVRGLRFLDEAMTANAYAARLKRQGVNAIVLLIHQGGAQSGDPTPNGCANVTGDIVPIVRKLSDDIRIVISGHTHEFYNCTIGSHLVTSASAFGRMITRIKLTIDPSTDTITAMTATNEIVTRDVSRDPTETAIVAKYTALAAPIADRVVASVTGDITRVKNRAGESALGDVVADAQLAATSTAGKGGAAVAFMNQSGIRGDIIANNRAGHERPGEVTYSELFTLEPFGNVLTVMTMTGEQIRRLLEQQFTKTGPQADVLQVSKGFSYSYRLNAAPGQHVDRTSIQVNGHVIAADDKVRVATNNYLAAGASDFTVFKEGTARLGGESDIDALTAYFKIHSPIAPGPQNRIARLD